MLFFVGYACYVGYTAYEFYSMEEGAVAKHDAQLSAVKLEVDGFKKKLAEGQKFMKSLELKKADIQAQVKRLNEFQVKLSETPDIPILIKTLITEAKQIELRVSRIEPGKKTPKEYYIEQEFAVEVKGTFQQLALFAQRVSKLSRILRIESYSLKPDAQLLAAGKKKMPITANLSVRAYQYALSQADAIAKTSQGGDGKPGGSK